MIVPSIDVRGGRIASPAASAIDPGEAARAFVAAGAEELHLVDLDGAERGDQVNLPLLAAIARAAGVPCRLAGGIASVEQADAAVAAGFAGVLFSSAVFGDDELLRSVAALSDRAIVEIESRDGYLAPRGGEATLVADATGRGSLAAARAAVDAGIRSLYVIDLGAEGRLAGPPTALLEQIRSSLGPHARGIAFHTGGGIRDLEDVRALARWGAASAVIGRALAERRFSLAEARAAAAG